jgi:hypothetical protein
LTFAIAEVQIGQCPFDIEQFLMAMAMANVKYQMTNEKC